MDQVIQNYKLLEEKKNLVVLETCDFFVESKNCQIPLSFKAEKKFFKIGYLVYFYFNTTPGFLIEKWKKSSENLSKEGDLWKKNIKLAIVNLDLEKKLYQVLKNIPISNPFSWMKQTEEKKEFVVFYYDRFPQFFYSSDLEVNSIKNFIKNSNFDKETERKKEEKFKVFGKKINGVKNYYKALDNYFYLVNKGTSGKIYQIQENEILKVETDDKFEFFKFYEFNEDKFFFSGKIDKVKFNKFFKIMDQNEKNEKRDITISLDDSDIFQGEEWSGYFTEVNQAKEKRINDNKEEIKKLALGVTGVSRNNLTGINIGLPLNEYLNEINNKIK